MNNRFFLNTNPTNTSQISQRNISVSRVKIRAIHVQQNFFTKIQLRKNIAQKHSYFASEIREELIILQKCLTKKQ